MQQPAGLRGKGEEDAKKTEKARQTKKKRRKKQLAARMVLQTLINKERNCWDDREGAGELGMGSI